MRESKRRLYRRRLETLGDGSDNHRQYGKVVFPDESHFEHGLDSLVKGT